MPPPASLLVALLVLALPQAARGDHGPCPREGAPRTVCTHPAETAPRVDGRLDDAVWQEATFTDAFVQREPVEGAAPSERTEVAFAYTDAALYVAARLYDRDPSHRRPQVTRRDEAGTAERLVVSLDTYRDRRTAYSFGVTSGGVRLDYYHPSDNEWDRDETFDPVWTAEAHLTSWGWTAEMRIPFSQLRFEEGGGPWGLNVTRVTPARNERVYWTLIPEAETGWASRFGPLVGLSEVATSRRAELRPYVAASATATEHDVAADPLREPAAYTARTGGEASVGLGSTLTLSATVNPDFGQVEADPAVVNLSAFEVFFRERRPFFTEDRQLLEGGSVSGEIDYFYSRRIGASPPGEADGDFVERPHHTTILGAAKLTGRLPSGLSVGALAAVTGREHAAVFDSLYVLDRRGRPADTLHAHRRRVVVAPPSAYGVLRLRQELGDQGSGAGLMLTGVERRMEAASPLEALLPRRAVAASADVDWRFRDGRYRLAADVGLTRVAGSTEAVADLQRSSRRYFDRPDADHVALDTARTRLDGYRAGLRFEKRAGRHWRWTAATNVTSPGFELNDLGRQRRADAVNPWLFVRYQENAPGRFYQEYNVDLFTDHTFNYAGVYTGTYNHVRAGLTWRNFWQTRLRVRFSPRVLSDVLTRGGPLMERGRSYGLSLDQESAEGVALGWELEGDYGWDELGGRGFGAGAGLAYRPAGRWQLRFGPAYRREVDARQYVATVERPGFDRYVFATLERRTLSAELRVNVAFSPEVTLELYAEPYATGGRFARFGELSAPRHRTLRPYAPLEPAGDDAYLVTDAGDVFEIDRPDFRFLSFRSNLVLRWQWRPGSTFFLVWQQDRAQDEAAGHLAAPRDFAEALGAAGDHFVALKLTYWLPVG